MARTEPKPGAPSPSCPPLPATPWNRLAVLWIGALIIVSLQPLRPPTGSELHGLHRPFHFVAFGLAALLLWILFATATWTTILPGNSAAGHALKAILATIVLGGCIECLQHFLYGNSMEWRDIADDAAAAIATVVAASSLLRLKRNRPQMQSRAPR